MFTPTSLPTALLQFAYTGVLGPHLRTCMDHQPPRVVSTSERVFVPRPRAA